MNEKELIQHIDEVASLMTPGVYEWQQSAPGIDRHAYIDGITAKTEAHPEQNERVHAVGSKTKEGEDLTVAICGFGPKSHANARAITTILNALPWLLQKARTGVEVENLAPSAGICRSREHGWRCVEFASPDEPDAPPMYTCGAGDTALEVAQIHRKQT